jgi:DNA invertase Pin-like site-specific DNA recombinase
MVVSVDERLRIIGYARVSTEDQALRGVGLEAQAEAIEAECERRGWQLVEVIEDRGVSGAALQRPGLTRAMEILKARQADALVVAKLDRLSRSLLHYTNLMEPSRKQGWALIGLDLGVDTTTPAGEAMASVMATFAQFERRLIGQRTKEALAVKRANGVRLGRPPAVNPTAREWIVRHRQNGTPYQRLADLLNEYDWRPAHGGARWYASTVRSVYLSASKAA